LREDGVLIGEFATSDEAYAAVLVAVKRALPRTERERRAAMAALRAEDEELRALVERQNQRTKRAMEIYARWKDRP
jgi:hypothetical protein